MMTVAELQCILQDYPADSPVYMYAGNDVYTIEEPEAVCEKSREFGIMLVEGNKLG